MFAKRYSATSICLVAAAVNYVQSTTVPLNASQPVITVPFFYNETPFRLEGSIVAIESQTTTARVYCARGPHYGDCGFFPYETITFGPNTYNNYMSDEGFTGTQDCKTFGNTQAVCAEWATGSEANFPGSSTMTYTGTDVTSLQVTITGGAEKLTSATATPTAVTSLTSSTSASSSTSGSPSNTGAATALNPATPLGSLGLMIALVGTIFA